MMQRVLAVTLLCIAVAVPARAQLSQDAKFEILRTVIAQQAAARIALPADASGVELTDAGEIDQEKVTKQLRKDGVAIDMGKVITVTGIDFGSKTIDVELDGGGKNKKGILSRIEVGIGNQTRPVNGGNDEKAKGSKLVLKFAGKVPSDLTPDQLRALLDPILDFNKSNFLKTGIDALPPEFREAVLAKEARIGMDRSTVLMALGRPNNRVRETTAQGVEQEDWIYYGRGLRATFVTFEDNVVIRIQEHGAPAQ